MALADFHNQETGRCDPSLAGIAKKTGLSERAVRYAIRELELAKAIITVERQQRSGRGKKNLTNRYKITLSSGAQFAGGMGHNLPPNLKASREMEIEAKISAFDDLSFPFRDLIEVGDV